MSKEESRTQKSVRNTIYSFLQKATDIFLSFLLRTVFIHALGVSYLGVSSLFTNILTVLSLMELGVGGSIVFALYGPLANKNFGKVSALMQLYKQVYRVVGIAVAIVGVGLTPFLDKIINLPENIEGIYIIYWLYVANTAASYFLTYRRSLLIADQRSDINAKNQIVFRLIRFILLTVILLISHNFILYIITDILNTIASNIHITLLVKRDYSCVENAEVDPLSKAEKKEIWRYMFSGIWFKFGQTIVNSSDSIIISAFLSTILVGVYSNYNLVTSNLGILVSLLFSSITASIGNFAVTQTPVEAEKLYKKVWFINYAISYYLTVCTFCLITPFVQLWVGESYSLAELTVIVLSINFYITSMQGGTESFLGANGAMFYHNRYRSLVEGIVNIVVSIFFVKFTTLGITGVFLGTTVCFLCGRMWMDTHTLYKYWFKMPFYSYMFRYILYFLLTVCVAGGGAFIRTQIFAWMGLSIISWILCAIVISIISIVVFGLVFHRKEEFFYVCNMIIKRVKQ